ncbi:MAG: hypothetical protein RMY64_00330 [Nostoc sp. DedQUE08]|nr:MULTISPECIES: hypothetical protein [unclassified Nostoc]MDZ8033948.1 hypothetical protein [Nostoc sp. DedSLP04]MDZ8064076.1 hypothetical protein [Nostoc sp. DedQUE08]
MFKDTQKRSRTSNRENCYCRATIDTESTIAVVTGTAAIAQLR